MRTFLALMCLVFSPVQACGVLEEAEYRRKIAEDITLQRQAAARLAAISDTIFLGEVVSVDEVSDIVRVRVERALKGSAPSELTLPVSGSFTIACWPSDYFENAVFHENRSYVIYLKDGSVLRAGWAERSELDLSLRAEIRLIRREGGT